MFAIYEKLDNIIFKYNLDRHYPIYKMQKQAEKIVSELFHKDSAAKLNIACIIKDDEERKLFSHISEYYTGITFVLIKAEAYSELLEKNFDKVYILTYDGYDKLSDVCATHNIESEWLYDIFESKGLHFERDYYKIVEYNEEADAVFNEAFKGDKRPNNSLQLELFYQRKQYETETSEEKKYMMLEKMFFLSLWMKNFISAQNYINQMDTYVHENGFKHAWADIEKLLADIKEKLQNRKERDIIIYWLDAISYEEEKSNMPYLLGMIDKSVSFTNAFTVTPYTQTTTGTMFAGVKPLDEEKKCYITRANSEVLRDIEEHGYEYKVISGIMRFYESKYFTTNYHEPLDTCSMIYWDVINNLLLADKPMVLLAHALELHEPSLSTKMESVEKNDFYKRREQAKYELDEQLEFYDKYIPNSAVRIYMSDHGAEWEPSARCHVMLNIYEEGCKSEKIKEMFSLIDFSLLMKAVLNQEKINFEKKYRTDVEIQDFPWYSKKIIEYFLWSKKEFLKLHLLGYKGIITEEYVYIYFANGKEILKERSDGKGSIEYCQENQVCDEKLLEQFRVRCSYPLEILKETKFEYSRYLYSFLEKQNKYIDNQLIEFGKVIENKLEECSLRRIGIRLGGYHSKLLYIVLPISVKNKIMCFIDNDANYECKRFGLPIVSLKDAMSLGVEGIILSSFKNLAMLKEEAETYKDKVKVIDVYKFLEEEGTVCYTDFFWELAPDDLWDVGFPFEE